MAVIIAFALAGGVGDGKPKATPSGPPPPVTASAPPVNASAEGPCAQVLSALPVQLGQLAPRVVHTEPDSPNVVAWGDPAVVLRCGVPRPPQFVPTAQLILSGVYWLPVKTKNETVFTAVDRAVYVDVTIPTKQAYIPLPQLGKAIASKLKPVCTVPEDNGTAGGQLCVNRK